MTYISLTALWTKLRSAILTIQGKKSYEPLLVVVFEEACNRISVDYGRRIFSAP